MALKLYDTLTRKIRPLQASDGSRFRFYVCGPTVYGPTHIGNFRTMILGDILFRVLQLSGMNPYYVRNLTDVDDKTIDRCQKAGIGLEKFTTKWIQVFHSDCEKLNILPPSLEPRATQHIDQQILLIQKLVDAGYAYKGKDGAVYFDVRSFKNYGRLSRLKNRELRTQETTSEGRLNLADNYDRESVADFALWKTRKSSDGENYWPSPWGEGRPGWHLECSAMSMEYLGESFDLHGGGSDLCFPHHENEIAQSEAATGRKFAQHWMHGAMLQVDSQKMSKSMGNIHTVNEILDMGYSPMDLRYTLLTGHYRQPLNFTQNGLESARSAIRSIAKRIEPLLKSLKISKSEFENLGQGTSQISGPFQQSWADLLEDLNTPKCLGTLFKAFNETEVETISHNLPSLSRLLFALGIRLFTDSPPPDTEIPKKIVLLAEQRWKSKREGDFATADALREELQSMGWIILDRKDRYEIQKQNP